MAILGRLPLPFETYLFAQHRQAFFVVRHQLATSRFKIKATTKYYCLTIAFNL